MGRGLGHWAAPQKADLGWIWAQAFPNQSPDCSWTYGLLYNAARTGLDAFLGDDLTCADRGPKTFRLTPAHRRQPRWGQDLDHRPGRKLIRVVPGLAFHETGP